MDRSHFWDGHWPKHVQTPSEHATRHMVSAPSGYFEGYPTARSKKSGDEKQTKRYPVAQVR